MAGDVRSYGRDQEEQWVVIQRQTFTNWVNEQLRESDLSVNDLNTDFCDGIRLCALMEVLVKGKIGRYKKKPINQHQYLDNVSVALSVMVKDKITLVNIGKRYIV